VTRVSIPSRLLRLPRRTIRLRLTLLYGALFLGSGAALLGVTYLLVKHQYTQNGGALFFARSTGRTVVRVRQGGLLPGPLPGIAEKARVAGQAHDISTAALNQLLINSGIALAIMALLSIWLGWLVAGRALRPLRTIANTAREISASNLHQRLALHGPDDEIKQLGNTFDDLLRRLESSFDAQRQFAANASHELRTPLTLERTLIEVTLADPDASPAMLRETLGRLLVAGEQQERLIEALLTLSRSQRGLDRNARISLAATTARMLDGLDTAGLAVTTNLEPAWTSGDPELIDRLIANLLANAKRHNIPGGHIDIRSETRASRAVFTVDNGGPRVPADQVERLFQPFQRLDRERTNDSNGFGLGLSIVHAIAAAHQATVSAEPRADGGLHIEVGFPSIIPPRQPSPSAGSEAGAAKIAP
jgi:signal transduction histidine kinase